MLIATRQALPEDLEAILNLFKGTIETVNAKDYSSQAIKAWSKGAYKKENWLSKMEAQFFIVAELDNNLVGFGSITDQGYLDLMYVSKDHQHVGVGKTIFRGLEAYANSNHLEKIVSDASITAKPFFETLGFVVVAEQQVTIDGVQLKNYKMAKTVR